MNRSDSPKLSLSINKFCELYNDVPKVFEAYATMVNLNAETYRGNTSQIIFEEEANSNYWIISFDTTNDAWLVPNPSRKVNYATLKSLPFAFDSNNQDHLKQLSLFVLSEPAQVIALPTEPTTWKLTKRGVIVFGDIGQQKKELQDIISSVEIEEMVEIIASKKNIEVEKSLSFLYDGIESQHNDIAALLGLQINEISKLNDQHNLTEKSLKNYEKQVQNLIREQQKQAEEISVLKLVLTDRSVGQSINSIPDMSKIVGDIQVLKQSVRDINIFLEQQNLQNQKMASYQQNSEAISANHHQLSQKFIEEKLGYQKQENDLLEEYNSSLQEVLKSLWDMSKNVSITDEAIEKIRDGNVSNITFKLNHRGNFVIITRGGYCYLVPNKQCRIISHVFTLAQALYKFIGYNESYADFSLIKPALVTEESSNYWRLSQQGILEFSSVKVAADFAPSYPFLEIYIRNTKTFQNQYSPKTVAEDIDSFQKRSAGEHKDMILREYNHGLYWLFNNDSLIYLIPSSTWKINHNNMQTANNLFNCRNYTSECRRVHIVHPAIVSVQARTNGRWKLKQKGTLSFT